MPNTTISATTITNQPVKFTENELNNIKSLGAKFQETVFNLGQLYIERLNLENAFKELADKEKHLQEEYLNLQKEEQNILNNITAKYGNGVLNIKDGTFTPNNNK